MNKHYFKTLALQTAIFGTLCLGSYALAHAETIQGVLEQSGSYSALFAASPESGDLIGYPFKSNSAVGKTILANCLPGLVCKVGKATTRNMRDASALTFKDQPMGWMEVTQAANAGMVSASNNYEKSVKTRFGTLAVAADNVSLQMNGKPVLPGVAGNNSLSIVASYELGNADVVLVKNSGGSGCPAMYSVITLTKTSLRANPEFGTCSDIIRATSDLKSSVTVVMVGFSGPFESAAERGKAGMTKTVFRYANGQLTRLGTNP
jgi:hypothetical protein